ncbi:MAG: vitamin K epoxide reductase family protein, partial [Gemmatimonadales bacterium]
MPTSLTLNGWKGPRLASLLIGLGMIGASLLTIHHFFAANFPASIYAGSFCDISAFFNCNSSAFAPIAQFGGVPLGYFGLMVGALVVLGTLFPSETLERTNLSIATVNALGVVGLAVYSVAFYGSLCLYCSLYWLFSLISFGVFWRWGVGREIPGGVRRLARPSVLVLAVFAVVLAGGAFGYARFTAAKALAQTGGDAARVVREYFALPHVAWPSTISPFWSVRSTARFEDAPIQVVEYADFLCSDCLMAYKQMQVLKRDFAGKINIAFQPFPLEARCNGVVDKNKHPGACDVTAIALAAGPERFSRIHDEIFDHFRQAKTAPWREALALRYGVAGA